METLNTNFTVVETQSRYMADYVESVYGSDSIVSYGPDNNMPTLLRNCYRQSATLKSLIDGFVNYILGDEVVVNTEAGLFKEQVNRSGMSMRQFVANLALSYMQFGGFAFQVIYSNLYVPVELYPLDFARCRTNENGTKIFYSKKAWSKYGTKSETFDRYDRKSVDPNKKTQIFYFKGDYTQNVYPLPTWYGALNDVLTEIECSRYSLNSVANGFQAKYLFNIPNVANLSEEQKKAVEDGIKTKFCGPDAQNNFMLYFNDGTNKFEVSKIEADDTPEKYIAIKDNARSNIYTALRATPNLFGLPTATTGFNSQEYASAYKLFQKTVINPIQDCILECINKVLGDNAVEITPFLLTFED